MQPFLNMADAKRQARADFGWGARGRIADDQLNRYHGRVAFYIGQDSFEGAPADTGPPPDSDSHLAAVALAGMGSAPFLLQISTSTAAPPVTSAPLLHKRHISELEQDPSTALALVPMAKRPAPPILGPHMWPAPHSAAPQLNQDGSEPQRSEEQPQSTAHGPTGPNGVWAAGERDEPGPAQRGAPEPAGEQGGQPWQRQEQQRLQERRSPPPAPPPAPPQPPQQQQQRQQQQQQQQGAQQGRGAAAAAAAERLPAPAAPVRSQQAKQAPLRQQPQQRRQQPHQQQQQQWERERERELDREREHERERERDKEQQQQAQEQKVAVGSAVLMDVLTKLASANHHHAVQATIARAEVFIQRAVESGGDANLAMGLLAQMLQSTSDMPNGAMPGEPHPAAAAPPSQPPSPFTVSSGLDLSMAHASMQAGPSMPVPVVSIQAPGQPYRPTMVFTSASGYGRGPPAPIPVMPQGLGQLVLGQVGSQSMLHG